MSSKRQEEDSEGVLLTSVFYTDSDTLSEFSSRTCSFSSPKLSSQSKPVKWEDKDGKKPKRAAPKWEMNDDDDIGHDTMLAVIGHALQDMQVRSAFMLGDLEASGYEQILEEEMLNKSFRYVSRFMAQSLNPKKSKKKENQVLRLLQVKWDMWVNEICKHIEEISVDKAKSETGVPAQSLNMEKTMKMPKKSNKQKSKDESSQKSPKKKMPRWDTSTKKKKSSKKSMGSTLELETVQAAVKKKFEEKKAQILAEVPDEYKSKWWQVGFGKWGKDWLPCLIFLAPYDVGALLWMCEEWFYMFEDVSIQCLFDFLLYVRSWLLMIGSASHSNEKQVSCNDIPHLLVWIWS